MEIISLPFLLFALAVVLVYARLSRPAQNIWLLFASYFFYLTWGLNYALVLVVSTLLNYWLGLRLGQEHPRRAIWLRLGILANVLALVALKALASPYGVSFFKIFGWSQDNPYWTSILLPVGFSFYTLQAISYLVDVSRGQTRPAHNLADFALYMAYFPKMLSGPIERAGHFMPQLERERKVDNAQLGRGLGLILVGLLRKMVIADGLSAIRPPDLFIHPANFSTLEHGVWLVMFAFELYNDFAGYTSIVRGLSALMGIELSPNFAQPFFARSFGEFWNRWHISFSSWLRDYIFFPLRRWILHKRLPAWVALTVPLLLTMLASGYWHGASISMLVWGGLHGCYQVLEQKLRKPRPSDSAPQKILSTLLVFTFVTLAWIPFATADFMNTIVYVRSFLPPYGFAFTDTTWLNIGAALLFSLALDWQEYRANSDVYFMEWSARAQTWAVFGALLVLALLAGSGPNISNFVYQGF